MKKIILTVTNDLNYDQRMHKICTSLVSANYEVELVGRELPHSIPIEKKVFAQTRLRCFFGKGKLFYAEYNLRLFFYLLFQKFDAVCAIDLDTIAACVLSAKIKRKKIAFDAHEHFTQVPEVIRRPGVQRVWKWVESVFVPMADAHYTVSPGLAEIFTSELGRKFELVMNVPVLQLHVQRQTNNEKYLLYQGALNEGRGLEHLLVAMKDIELPLYVAGEGDLSHKLRHLAVQYRVEHKVKFLGFVKPDELHKLTSRAWLGLHISEPLGLSYYYSLGNKFFDYIHAGLPQVCTSMPEYEQINQKFEVALMIKTSTSQEIIIAIQRLLTEEEHYQRLKKNCEFCAQHYNWQKEEKKLLNIYEQLLR